MDRVNFIYDDCAVRFCGKYNFMKMTLFVFCILTLKGAFGAYYDTLPKGVRLFAYRYVKTGEVNSSYGSNRQESTYFLKQNFDAKTLHNLNSATEVYFDELKRISEKAYDDFTFGEYEGSGEASVQVSGYGLGYGVTNKITLYGSLPYYKADVKFNLVRNKGNNHAAVAKEINNSESSEVSNLLSQLTRELPDAKESLLQSIATNYYGYRPIGDWSGEGFGDAEVGLIYRLTDWRTSGLALTGGVVLPTGRTDDPDILQDIAFGDGQTDVFMEFGGGVKLFKEKVDLSLSARYTYQMSSEKELRIPQDDEFPLSQNKGKFEEKLGNKWDLNGQLSLQLFRWLSPYGSYSYSVKEKSQYDSAFKAANTYLAKNSNTEAHTVKFGLNFSTVKLYQLGKFMAPFVVDLSMQSVVKGQNTPKYDRVDLELRLFF